MKFNILNVLPSLFLFLFAVMATQTAQPQKAVIVSYPADTPDSVLAQAKAKILEMGGYVTHEYHIIKAFAATAPAKALDFLSTLGGEYVPTIEEDQIVSINNGPGSS